MGNICPRWPVIGSAPNWLDSATRTGLKMHPGGECQGACQCQCRHITKIVERGGLGHPLPFVCTGDQGRGVEGSWLARRLSRSPPLRLSASPPLLLSTSPPLHLSTSPPLHLSTSPPLHLSTSPPLHL